MQPKTEPKSATTHPKIEQRFEAMLIELYSVTGEETGYYANRFLQKVRKDGGVAAAKYFLKPSKGISPGLEKLWKLRRLDLALETIVLRPHWRRLFTEAELKVAQDRLDALPPL